MNNLIKDMVNVEVMKAALRAENRYEDGTINWNFVDADAFMAVQEAFGKSNEVVDFFYDHFDNACDALEAMIEA